MKACGGLFTRLAGSDEQMKSRLANPAQDAILPHMRCLIAACLTICALTASEHHGQVNFGGLPVPGATVTATQSGKKLLAVTDQQGAYSFADLADGVWTIQVEMLCFSPTQREITIAPNAPAEEWELKLLPIAEIRAAAVAPPPPPPATLAANQPAQQPDAKPSKNPAPPSGFQRTDVNATGNAAATPPDEDAALPTADVAQRASDGFLINGTTNNGASSPFMLNPAFGNSRRGPRSLYNGSIGFNMDNSALDARSFSLTGQDTAKPSYNRFTGLASFGGPLRIPHLLRNGPTIVVNYQWTRNTNANTVPGLMPTIAERGGDLSQTKNLLGLPVHFLDPTTGVPFGNNMIPDTRLSNQAKALLKLFPLPNFDGSARYNYQIPLVSVTHQDSLQSRVNKSVDRKNQLSGNLSYQNTRADSQNLFNFLDTTDTTGINAGINWRHIFTTRLFANIGYQFSRLSLRTTPFFQNRLNVSGLVGISGNNQEAVNWGPPALNFAGGISGLSDAQQALSHNQTSGISLAMLWNHNGHNVSFGADLRRQQFNLRSQQDPRGTFTFTGASTSATSNGVPVQGTGSDLAGFLLGIPDTSSIAFGNADKYFRAWNDDAFVTDDWRINPSLTVNFGVRWEYGSPITELYGRLVNLDIVPGFSAEAPVVARNPVGTLTGQKYPDSLLQPDKHAFQPRIALSWRPFAASSMVVRAGYGVYYNSSVYQSIATQMAQQSPLSTSLTVQNTPANPLTLANGFVASSLITPNTFAVDPNFRVGYTQNWQVSVQRDLPASLVMTVTYLGIKGTRAAQVFLPNTYPSGAVNPCPACPTGFAYLASNGNSTRESGTFQLRRRLHSGFTATMQYAYSKSIDDAALGGRNQGGSVIAQDWLNLRGERGLSNFDQRHLLTAQLQYTTGMGLGGGTLLTGWKSALFKEWTAATQITAGSGLPLTPTYFAAVGGTGVTGSIRPDYTGAPLYAAPPGFFLNPAAYTAPASGHWGNAGRDSITGPRQFLLNASFGRTFRVSDRVSMDFRLDATNALNHVTFPNWNTTVTSFQFGLPSTANPMRNIQTVFRARF
ncbi:MAG TPA: carboxypeptidase regulatory-like domain-containing protein [Bryobacteraceae bacterium]|nr:carboxypeptidase regulatory-like domain-containing protein [Bryobacteraceae bacterium]